MEHRNLGPSGLRVSLVGLGCNNFGAKLDLESTRAVVDAAIDAIMDAARTGEIGDGRVFVLPVEQSRIIRTGERDVV